MVHWSTDDLFELLNVLHLVRANIYFRVAAVEDFAPALAVLHATELPRDAPTAICLQTVNTRQCRYHPTIYHNPVALVSVVWDAPIANMPRSIVACRL